MNEEITFKPCNLVIFGALGDLSRRKLLISLYRLEKANLLEADTRIIGVDQYEGDNSEFTGIIHKSLQEFLNESVDEQVWATFSARFSYLKIDFFYFRNLTAHIFHNLILFEIELIKPGG